MSDLNAMEWACSVYAALSEKPLRENNEEHRGDMASHLGTGVGIAVPGGLRVLGCPLEGSVLSRVVVSVEGDSSRMNRCLRRRHC